MGRSQKGEGGKTEKLRKERSPSTPLETTSTEAMDTEEAQEISKEIVAKATERQLKRQECARYQQRRQQTVEYDFPKPGTIPVPQLEKPRKKESPGLNQCCPTLRYLTMKKYPCSVESLP